MIFKDKISFDINKKKLISIRDGIQEYLGLEFNKEFQDEHKLKPSQRYTVYRSVETLKDAATLLDKLPITNEHIDISIDRTLKEGEKQGEILSSEVVDNIDTDVNSTVAVQNEVQLSDTMLKLCQSGKGELSLGYEAKMIIHDVYDFEQVEVNPHHLALVQNGRCGKTCKILDKRISVILLNEDGTLNQDNIQMVVAEMPKAIEIMSDEEKTKLFEVLGSFLPEVVADTEKVEDTKDDTETEKVEDSPEEEDKEEMKDKAIANFKDSADFQKMLDSHAHIMADAIIKAKNWMVDYETDGKSLDVIMKDTLAKARPSTVLKDCEIGVAFKMLDEKPLEIVTIVKDSAQSKWESIKEKD
tara:strand:- start:299 stop:1369 length:1071 start_codon:yes stop_codon:yes gene_type:complete